MRIIAVVHSFNWEWQNHIRTLKNMGHDVIWYDWGEYGFDQYSQDWQQTKRLQFNQHLINFIKKQERESKIDLFFSHLSDPLVDLETLQAIKNTIKCPIVNFAWNDLTAFQRYEQSAKGYDITWTCNKEAVQSYLDHGINAIYIPPGINPMAYDCETFPYMSDLSFIGQMYGYRGELLSWLSDQFSFRFSGKIDFAHMLQQIATSKINLGFCGFNEFDGIKQLRLRDFEIPVCKGFYLAQHNQDLSELFEQNKEIAFFDNIRDLPSIINYWLENNEKREEVKLNGYRAVVNRHTWELRFKALFKLMNV